MAELLEGLKILKYKVQAFYSTSMAIAGFVLQKPEFGSFIMLFKINNACIRMTTYKLYEALKNWFCARQR